MASAGKSSKIAKPQRTFYVLFGSSWARLSCGCGRQWMFTASGTETRNPALFCCRCGNEIFQARFRPNLIPEQNFKSEAVSKLELSTLVPKGSIPSESTLTITAGFELIKRYGRPLRVIFNGKRKFLVDDIELDKAVMGLPDVENGSQPK